MTTTTYTFKIEDYTPESMPFGRLVEYYLEIKRMLDITDHLHLVDVIESSHGSAFKVDRNYETTLTKRFYELNEGTAPKKAQKAQAAINAMLREDATSGVFFDSANQNVIQFPGQKVADGAHLRIRGSANFTGELYHIAGSGGDAKARISTDLYGVVFCTTTRDIAKSLRDFLFEEVKVSGRGLWSKGDDGRWDIDNFVITDFSPISRESLRDSIKQVREIGVEWPEDPLGDIRHLEERNGTTL